MEKGIDIATISGLLGHADVTTTTHYYVHPREEPMRQAMSAMGPVGRSYMRQRSNIPQNAVPNRKAAEPASARVFRRRKNVR